MLWRLSLTGYQYANLRFQCCAWFKDFKVTSGMIQAPLSTTPPGPIESLCGWTSSSRNTSGAKKHHGCHFVHVMLRQNLGFIPGLHKITIRQDRTMVILWLYYGYTMVILLWLYYGYTTMVILLWLYYYGYTTMVILLWLYYYGYTTMVILWLDMNISSLWLYYACFPAGFLSDGQDIHILLSLKSLSPNLRWTCKAIQITTYRTYYTNYYI